LVSSLILLQHSNGLTKVDSELARLRGLLEKKYSNDHDAGYTYINPISLDSIPLTPFMMKEWARAMVISLLIPNPLYIDSSLQYDGSVSVSHPPSTATFDPVNRKASLRTRNHPNPVSTPASHGLSGDLAHISQIISSVASIARVPSKPPSTPTRRRASSCASIIRSPTQNTPSKLSRFLEYAETNLGVENARSHEESLRIQGFGPDILHLVDDAALKDVGFTPGDVIRLKQNSQQWWNSVDAKRKRTNDTPSPAQSTPPSKRVAFEKRYHDGGRYRFYGPKIVEGDFTPGADVDWFYYCKARDAMVPLPPGHKPILEGEDEVV
jgi:hypothetical protein